MNSNAYQSFRDQLLESEQFNLSYKEKYEKEVQAMIERKLTGIIKLPHIIGLITGLVLTIFFGAFAIIVPILEKGFPFQGRFICAMGAVFGLITVIVEGRILKKGTINLKKDYLSRAGLDLVVLGILAILVFVISGGLLDRLMGVQMLALLLFGEVAVAVAMLQAVIVRSELNTREKLLGIEYRLAELAEQITKK
ncbi:MAG: hypothetical protein KJ887_03295 [Candidatus Omnitrophica bacterium]|nr:hypothetical protein [Candidatus Omnitrophota bacterium]MBU1048192.1 hypothetical protein [Candidatus Omnitrophota bacterium]MBU1631398.1 hypothetical protein [Candidatus Omnitrophota bacterium]MBU1767733.1 hypothetical protein [Candidatus Omnitrophota bacterium]MBU1888714.1 hypothetical protein [Candidatus Omnitrophota bacterium]